MSAFLQSGRSERQNLREIRVRFRPEADMATARFGRHSLNFANQILARRTILLVAEQPLELSPHELRAVPHVHCPTHLSMGQVKTTVYVLQTFFAGTMTLKCL